MAAGAATATAVPDASATALAGQAADGLACVRTNAAGTERRPAGGCPGSGWRSLRRWWPPPSGWRSLRRWRPSSVCGWRPSRGRWRPLTDAPIPRTGQVRRRAPQSATRKPTLAAAGLFFGVAGAEAVGRQRTRGLQRRSLRRHGTCFPGKKILIPRFRRRATSGAAVLRQRRGREIILRSEAAFVAPQAGA